MSYLNKPDLTAEEECILEGMNEGYNEDEIQQERMEAKNIADAHDMEKAWVEYNTNYETSREGMIEREGL